MSELQPETASVTRSMSIDKSSLEASDIKLQHGVAYAGMGTTFAVIEEEGEAAFAVAREASPLDARSWRSFQLYGILLIVSINATASGFDGALMGSS
jgi:hypothetical protein